eukprot:TRINITY_DN9425_c0_g1_i2.p1 TRINITY_DN9425_c0_g1~~TRINITY_DN9425_c0_g1_i2.p1  ORF type:complete len:214 (+),score=49.47 TRINITY_DN9425_c0_g1_i2:97-642(+)
MTADAAAPASKLARWPGPAPSGENKAALAEWIAAAMRFADAWEGPEESDPGFHAMAVPAERLRTRELPNLIKLAEKYDHWHQFAATFHEDSGDCGESSPPASPQCRHADPDGDPAATAGRKPAPASPPAAAATDTPAPADAPRREPERVPPERLRELPPDLRDFLSGDWDRLLVGRRGCAD